MGAKARIGKDLELLTDQDYETNPSKAERPCTRRSLCFLEQPQVLRDLQLQARVSKAQTKSGAGRLAVPSGRVLPNEAKLSCGAWLVDYTTLNHVCQRRARCLLLNGSDLSVLCVL